MEHLFFLVFFATFQSILFCFFMPELVTYFVKIISNNQRQNIALIPSIVATPLTVVSGMKGFDKDLQT